MAARRRPLYFCYDPLNPTEIHVMFRASARRYHPTYALSSQWTNANTDDVTKMASAGLFDTLVVHVPGSDTGLSNSVPMPRLSVSPDTDIDQLLDTVRDMGPPWNPKPKKNLRVPFDFKGNQLHRVDRGQTNVVWKDNYTFMDTMTFGNYVKGGSSAAYFIITGSDGRRYNMFLHNLQDAIHHIENGVLSGKFTFCKRGVSYGVKLLDDDDEKQASNIKPRKLTW
jgi:hypothetical protein